MRGRLTRERFDRLENVLIVLLSCSAILLLGWILTMQHIEGPWDRGDSPDFSGGQTADAEGRRPAAILLQVEGERYGVQYRQDEADALYDDGLGALLETAITTSGTPEEVSEGQWRDAVSENSSWVWFDYLYDIPCPGWALPDGCGVRGFLLGENALYLYSDTDGTFYRCHLGEKADLSLLALPGEENGALFSFEAGEDFESLSPVGMLLPENEDLQAYTVSLPLAHLDDTGRRELMVALQFNPSTASVYQTADGTVIREGADNLRLEKDGTLVFHGSLGGETRYQAASTSVGDLTEKALELLKSVLPGQDEGAQMICREVLCQENGDTELRFCCLLNGVEVRLPDGLPAARFVFRGASLASFTIRGRYYAPAEGLCPVLPIPQAVALLSGEEQAGGELRLCYQDSGSGGLTAGWVLRTAARTEPEQEE